LHPDVAALMGAGPQGPPPAIQVNPADHPDNAQASSFADQIRGALDAIRAAITADDASDNEKLIAEKMTTLGQQLLATHEKEHQAALGGGPATNFLRRASGNAA
jgi:hypothetical protein